MAGMGPAPKSADRRARRNAGPAMTALPAEGRTGKAPRWPLIPDIATKARRDVAAAKVESLEYELERLLSEDLPFGSVEHRLEDFRERLAIYEARLKEQRRIEAALWRDIWKTPAAAQWERLGWTREIAQYVRFKVLTELGDMDAAKEARQWSDRLGLSPLALLRLRWEIAADEVAEKRQDRPASRSRYADLRVVDASQERPADAAGS